VGTLLQELSSLQLTDEPVMVQRKKKPSGAQRKHLRKQKEETETPPGIFNILTEVFIVPWQEIPGALVGDVLWAHLRPGPTKDSFASTGTGSVSMS